MIMIVFPLSALAIVQLCCRSFERICLAICNFLLCMEFTVLEDMSCVIFLLAMNL
jgi:hypothetical protein